LRNSPILKALATVATVLLAAAAAVAQNPTPDTTHKPQQPAAQVDLRPHVWTNDDIVLLRSPADIYQLEKEAQEAAEALAQERAKAELASKPPVDPKQPATLEETDRAIKESQEDIQDQKDTLARLRKELDESPENEKVEKAKEIDRRTAVLEASETELKTFQDRRTELAKATPATAAPPDAAKGVTSASAEPSCKDSGPACP
jgi:hypothetical protein